jgi:CHASE2 domain-containing sensor protein
MRPAAHGKRRARKDMVAAVPRSGTPETSPTAPPSPTPFAPAKAPPARKPSPRRRLLVSAAVVLAVVLVIVASGTFLPRRAARAVIVLAVALAAALWLAQGLGGILTGSATDPDTGPLLALLALAFWPLASCPGET